MFGRGGIDSGQLKKMMKQMGIEMEELSGVEEVVIKLSDRELVFKDAQVQVTEAQGQKTYQIIGKPEEQETGPEISDDDIKTVMDQVEIDEDQAREALKETDGDIAQAIVNLQES